MNIVLPKVVAKGKKRLGLGYGTGKGGHTVGRGEKGQKTRFHIGIMFEGMKVKKSLFKRLPFQRGRSKFAASPKPEIVSYEALSTLPAGSKVDLAQLVKMGLVDEKNAKKYGVKILAKGKMDKKLKIELPVSKSVAKKLDA